MNERSAREPDRRRHARIDPKGTVTLHALGITHRGRLLNIGAGGMYIATNVSLPERLLGQLVDLDLRFDGALAAWQRLSGQVSRIDANGAAIVFDAPPPLLRSIDELITASHASARVISVVLIDAETRRRAAIAAGFRAAGCQVVEVRTQLEAIQCLGESNFEPDIIAVANTMPATVADEMRAFVEHYHPSSMLVTIGPELLEAAGRTKRLSESTTTAELPARIRELLFAAHGQ